MNTKLVAVSLLSAAVCAAGARGQTPEVATPATPAPAVAPVNTSAATPAPNQTVYAPRLPAASELTSIAAAQGLTVERIVQTASQVTVIYKNANGQTNTVAYLLLPGTTGATVQVAAPTTPPPTVVYEPAPRVVYYDDYGYWPGYYVGPRYWYPPVSIGVGFGYRSGGYGFRGGFHHHR